MKLPKIKPKELIEVYNRFLRREEYKNDFVLTENSIENQTLRCVKCSKDYKCVKKSDLDQHLLRPIHLNAIKRSELKNKCESIGQNQFNKILANFCAKLNIPFYKVSDEVFISFIETFTNYKCPIRKTV